MTRWRAERGRVESILVAFPSLFTINNSTNTSYLFGNAPHGKYFFVCTFPLQFVIYLVPRLCDVVWRRCGCGLPSLPSMVCACACACVCVRGWGCYCSCCCYCYWFIRCMCSGGTVLSLRSEFCSCRAAAARPRPRPKPCCLAPSLQPISFHYCGPSSISLCFSSLAYALFKNLSTICRRVIFVRMWNYVSIVSK